MKPAALPGFLILFILSAHLAVGDDLSGKAPARPEMAEQTTTDQPPSAIDWKHPPARPFVRAETRGIYTGNTELLEELRSAKKTGDRGVIHSVVEELGWRSQASSAVGSHLTPAKRVVREDRRGRTFRWEDDDIRVSDTGLSVDYPDLAATSDGTLYMVCEDMETSPPRDWLDIYRSFDSGSTWGYWFSLIDGSDHLSNPSIAIAEGDGQALLIAYEKSQGTADAEIWVRVEWLGTGLATSALIDAYPLDHRFPKICVDYPEYGNWWPYIVYVSEVVGEIDYWYIKFRRSLDGGRTWTEAENLATVFNSGDDGPMPHVDFGGANLYVAYEKSDFVTGDRDVFVRRSRDLGANWEPEIALATTDADEWYPRVAATNGGGAVIVAYAREYLTPGSQYDIEDYYSTDAGDTWSWGYLPYNDQNEQFVDLCVSPSQGQIHAAFWRSGEIIYTAANHASPNTWDQEEDINHGAYGSHRSAPAITINPAQNAGACIAWSDYRDFADYLIYFDATYWPTVGVGSQEPSRQTTSLLAGPEPMMAEGAVWYTLSEPGPVRLLVVSPVGRVVRHLVDGAVPRGRQEVAWDGRDDAGISLPSGVYFYVLDADRERLVRRLTIVR